MTRKCNAGGQPAGAGNLRVSALQIALLIDIAVKAIKHSKCVLDVNGAHGAYLRALTDFEASNGRVEGRIDPRNFEHAAIIAATKVEYDAYQLAKRKAYNAGRRLQTVCRKAAGVNAHRAAGTIQ
jgi:hypothetical protein